MNKPESPSENESKQNMSSDGMGSLLVEKAFVKIQSLIESSIEATRNFGLLPKKKTNAVSKGSDQRRNTQTRYIEKLMEQQRDGKLVKITYEEIGLFPRSFNRVFDRVLKQILSEDIAELALQEYRLYRYLFLTTIKCLVSIIFIPLVINIIAKNWVIGPLTDYFWNGTHPEIFLNIDQQKRAFSDLQNLEDEIYFEALTLEEDSILSVAVSTLANGHNGQLQNINSLSVETIKDGESFSGPGPLSPKGSLDSPWTQLGSVSASPNYSLSVGSDFKSPSGTKQPRSQYSAFLVQFKEELTKRTIEKTKHIYIEYNEESVEMITNLISDFISLGTLFYLLLILDLEITVTKSFLFEMFFGLDDSRKSLIILLVTDLLVGYHSSNLWEVFFTFLFEHYGFNENHTAVYLLVATLPVLLDVLFKYLIFRHLNRTSPATVATYQALIE